MFFSFLPAAKPSGPRTVRVVVVVVVGVSFFFIGRGVVFLVIGRGTNIFFSGRG